MSMRDYPTFDLRNVIPEFALWALEKTTNRIMPSWKHLLERCKYRYYKTSPKTVINLFDAYAETFEEHLVRRLNYKTPEDLAIFIKDVSSFGKLDTVLDLGCGTGLLGPELRKHFKINRLIGVDISWKMLKQCKLKTIYKELHNADILEFLHNNSGDSFSLITASDVFVYVGDLNSLIGAAFQTLKSNGLFAFSVESAPDQYNFKLTHTKRYEHSLIYLQTIAKEKGFKNFQYRNTILRQENNEPVAGYLCILQK